MILTVYTIKEIIFKEGYEESNNLLRFRDKKTRNKYLKNVTLKPYLTAVENNLMIPFSLDTNIGDKQKFSAFFEGVREDTMIKIYADIENIEIIESLYQYENQLQLDL